MSVIDAYLDALWLEQGASDHTLAAYRRDLTAWQQQLDMRAALRRRTEELTVPLRVAVIGLPELATWLQIFENFKIKLQNTSKISKYRMRPK